MGFAPTPSRTGTRHAAGFTFIEMMVVIAIMSLMTALVVANLDGITARATLSRSARDLGNRLVFLRDLAVVQGREMSLEIDVANARWREIDRPSPQEVPDEKDRDEFTFYSAWTRAGSGVFLEGIALGREGMDVNDVFTVTYTEKGELFPSGFVAYFQHEELIETEAISVEVSGLTGTVSYHRGMIEAEEVREEHDF